MAGKYAVQAQDRAVSREERRLGQNPGRVLDPALARASEGAKACEEMA